MRWFVLSVLRECYHFATVFGWVGFNTHSGNNIPYTLPDELHHCICVYVNVIFSGYPEHFPVRVIKTFGQTNME
jgi:hypothetical protein